MPGAGRFTDRSHHPTRDTATGEEAAMERQDLDGNGFPRAVRFGAELRF